jgi:outer membrane immunogenic protein
MKKYLLAGVSAVALAAAHTAHAQPASMPSWAGWYVGGNAGYSFANVDTTFNNTNGFGGRCTDFEGVCAPGHHRADGFIGGGQVGYNWVLPYAVYGIEADFQGSGEKGSITTWSTDCEGPSGNTGHCGIGQSNKIQWFGTVRGRFGWLITPTIMPYVTAGLAYGQVKTSGMASVAAPACTSGTCSFSWSQSAVNAGFAGGVGVEAFLPGSTNWTWKVEYLWINLGSVSGSGTNPIFGGTYNYSATFTDNIFRAGINWHAPAGP